jgi:signal transduction histidine kinase
MEHQNRLGRRLQVRKVKQPIFPTLFSKLFTLYLTIILGIMLFFSVIFSNAFKQYFVEYTADIMLKQAASIGKEYISFAQNDVSAMQIVDKVFFKIQTLNSYLDATTWIVDRYSNLDVVAQSGPLKETNILVKQAYIDEVFAGNIIKIQSGFEEYFSTPVLTIGYPIQMNGKVERALFIHTPMPQILKTIEEVQMIMIRVLFGMSLITFVILYFVCREMTRPLKQMNQIAKEIAGGRFDKRISTVGGDEIGELGISFNDMARELEKIDHTRKTFIANVSHDMRSPLTSISGFVTAILDGTVPKEKEEHYLKIVLSESQRMIKMTNDILELNRLEEGNLPLRKMEFNIHEMIKDTLDNFEGITGEKNIEVSLILDEKEQIVFADPDKIIRVVQNLLDNAFKFVPHGGKIEVETKLKGSKVWVYIKNSGKPIPRQERHDIWERFYKADLSRGKDKKGMGIGLVIVKEMMKQHGEEIGVLSPPDGLVTFYFSLAKKG